MSRLMMLFGKVPERAVYLTRDSSVHESVFLPKYFGSIGVQ